MSKDDDKAFLENAYNSINEWMTWSFLNEEYNGKYTPVFHYCSIEVMKSIIENRKLRFTDIRYLNDLQEFTYVQDVYQQACLNEKDKFDKCFYDIINSDDILLGIDGYQKNYMISSSGGSFTHFQEEPCRVFVCCFSLESDELMMWNYYGNQNAGCNIEFSLMFPSRSLFKGIEFKKSNVIYGEESHDAVKKILDQAYTIWKGTRNNNFIYKFIVMQLNTLRLFLKHGGFKNEREYRIVLLVPESKISEMGLNFFIRGNMLMPYLEIELQNIDAEIKGINLGPYARNELNKCSVNDLLTINRLNEVSVNCSKVPIRNYSE